MKKALLLTSLVVFSSFSLTGCTKESPDKWAPNKAIDRQDARERRAWVKINDVEYEDKNKDITKAIYNAAPYNHAKKNGSQSSNYFIFSFDVSGHIFPANCTMTFFDDGYVEVESLKVDYIYSFDQDTAKELYETVVAFVNNNYQAQ